jgi:hypothetical protein
VAGRAEDRPQPLVIVRGVRGEALASRRGLDDRLQRRQVVGGPVADDDAMLARLPDATAGRRAERSEHLVLVTVRSDIDHDAGDRSSVQPTRDQPTCLEQCGKVGPVDRRLDLHHGDPAPPGMPTQRRQHGIKQSGLTRSQDRTPGDVRQRAEHGHGPHQQLAAAHQRPVPTQQDPARPPSGTDLDASPAAGLQVMTARCGGQPVVPFRVQRCLVNHDVQHCDFDLLAVRPVAVPLSRPDIRSFLRAP